MSAAVCPRRSSVTAAAAPAGPPPSTTASNSSTALDLDERRHAVDGVRHDEPELAPRGRHLQVPSVGLRYADRPVALGVVAAAGAPVDLHRPVRGPPERDVRAFRPILVERVPGFVGDIDDLRRALVEIG